MPEGYDLYRRDRSDGYGGVFLGIHNSLNSRQIDIKTSTDFVAAKIVNNNQDIIVASLYRPTDNNVVYMKDLTGAIANLCQSNPDAAIWVSGDINLPDIIWDTLSIRSSPSHTIAINKECLDLLDLSGLQQMVDFPTRRTLTTV